MAPRPKIPTAVMYRHPSCYTPLGRIYRVFAGFYWELLLIMSKGTVSWFLEWRIDRCTQKSSSGIKKVLKSFWCHIFACIRPTERYNLSKWGPKGHLIPLETSFFYLPDRPTAKKPLVKNPPFKESTDNALTVYVSIYILFKNFQYFSHYVFHTLWGQDRWSACHHIYMMVGLDGNLLIFPISRSKVKNMIAPCSNAHIKWPPKGLLSMMWQSPRNRVVTHWASMLRWIWSISEYNLTTRDSRKRTPMGGPFVRERRGTGPEKQQPKHNPCRPVHCKHFGLIKVNQG